MKKYGCADSEVAHYTSKKIKGPIDINGDLEKPVWKNAVKSPRFVDMVTRGARFIRYPHGCIVG